jgi:hypothetical protein
MKPTVKITDASLFGNRLYGITQEYPKEHMAYENCVTPGNYVRTSTVVKVDGNLVETQRTIYDVVSWKT